MGSERPAAKIGRPARVEGEKPTRDRIFEAALDLFAEHGFDRTSVRQIAKAVGLTESAIYRHFENKAAILEAIFAYAENAVYTPLPVEEKPKEGESIFRGLLSPLPGVIMFDPYIVKIMKVMYAQMQHDVNMQKYYEMEYIERANNYIEALFKRQMEQGLIRTCDARALARVFNGFRSEWSFQKFIISRPESIDIKKLEEDLEEVILFFDNLFVPKKEIE